LLQLLVLYAQKDVCLGRLAAGSLALADRPVEHAQRKHTEGQEGAETEQEAEHGDQRGFPDQGVKTGVDLDPADGRTGHRSARSPSRPAVDLLHIGDHAIVAVDDAWMGEVTAYFLSSISR
jgi:hypothetical protein